MQNLPNDIGSAHHSKHTVPSLGADRPLSHADRGYAAANFESASAAKNRREAIQLEDLNLMMKVAQSDEVAFARLYDRFSPAMFSMALHIVQSRPEAEDVLQDAFYVIWRRAADYNPQLGSPFTWVATIVRRKAIDRLRTLTSREKRRGEEQDRHTDYFNDLNGPAPIIATEQQKEIRAALTTLGMGEYRAIALAFFDGLTHVEIASALKLPVGTVKARIRRGMLKLRTKLAALNRAEEMALGVF